MRPVAGGEQQENVVVRFDAVPNQPHIVWIVFEARFWAAKVSFGVKTSQDIVQARVEWSASGGAVMQMTQELRSERGYVFRCEQPEIRPGYPVVFVLEFAPGVDALASIESVGHWDPG